MSSMAEIFGYLSGRGSLPIHILDLPSDLSNLRTVKDASKDMHGLLTRLESVAIASIANELSLQLKATDRGFPAGTWKTGLSGVIGICGGKGLGACGGDRVCWFIGWG